MKVWLVYYSHYDDFEVIDICTTEERAKLVAIKRNCDYEEHETDSVEIIEGEEFTYKITLHSNSSPKSTPYFTHSRYFSADSKLDIVVYKDSPLGSYVPHHFDNEGKYVPRGERVYFTEYEVYVKGKDSNSAYDKGVKMIEDYIKENRCH